ncbi:GntR family transcriptional regulator [Nocardia africana]|uniref:GntR family transcriptional regulator n=1 Tax=Nocardia africana TaxID=134964 RepID=A0ABW6NST1_9NOCA
MLEPTTPSGPTAADAPLDAGVATYVAVADYLQQEIATAEPGQRLPSEHELAASHNISRVTARAALQELERRHLVRRARGAGTFVARRIDFALNAHSAPSWSETIRRAGGVPETKIVSVDLMRPPSDVRTHLELASAAKVVRLVRLGYVDGLVASVTTTHMPASLASDLRERVAFGGSLYQTLQAIGCQPGRLWNSATMEVPDAEVAALLKIEGRPPIWRSEGCVIDTVTQRKIEFGVSWSRPDVIRYRFEFGQKP